MAARKPKKKEIQPPPELFTCVPTEESWKKIGTTPRFGTLIPLSALRSRRNQGIGDFADIPAFKDFSREIGSSIIQLLPINDMGRGKTPYSALSAFALDPVFIALDEIPEMKEGRSDEINNYLAQNWHVVEQQKRDRLINVDKLRGFKFGALYKLFWDFINRNKYNNTPRWRAFRSYVYNNSYWLDDYAIFRTLKNRLNWAPWQEWPAEFRYRYPEALKNFVAANEDEIDFVRFVQFTAYEQMAKAHNECRNDNILLKGDIPLQVDFESADVWAHPQYFNLDVCSGAPPDYYSQMGQNWGSPTYNWDYLGLDNYIWWRKRLEYASNFFDIYRIDHIVGIFRIWTSPITPEFPRGVPSGWNAFFSPEDPGEGIHKPVWENHGKNLLKMMIESTEMLPIGEDLGTIPYVCRYVMKSLGIPGYKVLIWERNFTEPGAPFFEPEEYGYLSMATTTTHDFWTLPGYYEHRSDDPGRAAAEEKDVQGFWEFIMGSKPFNAEYTEEFHKTMLEKLFFANSVFLIMPFQDLWGKISGVYGDDMQYDRINDPSAPDRPENWTTKFPLDLEDYPENSKIKELMEYLKNLTTTSGRVPVAQEVAVMPDHRQD